MRSAITAGDPCLVTLLNYRKDGTPFWNEVRIAPAHNTEGQITHFVGVQTDISARVMVEAALRKNQELLDAIVAHIPSMLLVKDAHDLHYRGYRG